EEDIAYTLFNLEVRHDHAKIRKEVAAYYKQVEEQNEQLRQKNYQLEIANKKACESDILKDSFLGMVSHELRTPLNGILGFTQLLQSSKTPVEKASDFIDVIHQSGIQLLQVVNNLLDISKIHAKQLTYHEKEFYVNDLFKDVVDANQYYIEKSGKVDFVVQNQLPQHMNISTDYEKLKQILNVLVSNALKFTRKGMVKIGCTKQGNNKLLFYVKDTGTGIEKEKSSIIFQTFRQSDESRTRKYGGTGLGLSIAKGLVSFLKGKIWFESEINQGSIFYFTIPVQINQTLTDNFNQNKMKEDNIPNWSDKTILIVEDDPFSSDYLVEALSETRVYTKVVSNGEEAVRLLKNRDDFDVVLMDIQLPGLSGDDATKQIRAFNKNIPIIAQTAHAMVSDREKYIRAGCTDYISKPIAVDDLFSILCNYI
ncbi:MAG: response regulator, partial [Bacteroidota bacterium]